MTPLEILEKYMRSGETSFLNELEGDDLWAYIAYTPHRIAQLAVENKPFATYKTYKDDAEILHGYVVAELKREREADWDTWNNLLALDKEIEQEWIDELVDYRDDASWRIPLRTLIEVIEYLQDRKHDA